LYVGEREPLPFEFAGGVFLKPPSSGALDLEALPFEVAEIMHAAAVVEQGCDAGDAKAARLPLVAATGQKAPLKHGMVGAPNPSDGPGFGNAVVRGGSI
jgi:hypothetical protein